MPNSKGNFTSISTSTTSALFMSDALNPRFNNISFKTTLLYPHSLPFFIIVSIESDLLNAASGFLIPLSCASVSFISLPAKISASAVSKKLSKVKF